LGVAALLLWTGVALDLGVLAGLVVRGRWRDAWLCPAVVGAALTSALAAALCAACNNWTFWLLNEFVHIALLLLLGVELSLRLCPTGPARRHAWMWIGVVALVIVALSVTAPPGPLMVQVLPRLIATVLFLYAGLTLVMAAHHLKINSALHAALLYGFPPYLFVYVVAWGYTGDDPRLANLAGPLAFNLMMLNLLRAVWQRDPAPRLGPGLIARVAQRLGWH
jgi:hypothetical protein